MSTRNILITGGYGYIGTYLVKKLVESGDRVLVFDQNTRPNSMAYSFTPEEWPNLKNIRGDVTNFADLEATCENYDIEYLVHLAALLSRSDEPDPFKAVEVNCLGTMAVFEAARKLSLKRVIWASSIAVYGPQYLYGEQPISNDAPHYPKNLYGVCKSFGEKIAALYSRRYSLNIVGFRFPIGYGIGRTGGKGIWVVDLFENSVKGKAVVISGGDDIVNLILVDDEADLIFTALKQEKVKSETYNVSGEVCSKKDLAHYVKELIPNAQISLSPGKMDLAFLFDDSLLQQELTWKPKHCLKDGIQKTVSTVQAKLQKERD